MASKVKFTKLEKKPAVKVPAKEQDYWAEYKTVDELEISAYECLKVGVGTIQKSGKRVAEIRVYKKVGNEEGFSQYTGRGMQFNIQDYSDEVLPELFKEVGKLVAKLGSASVQYLSA